MKEYKHIRIDVMRCPARQDRDWDWFHANQENFIASALKKSAKRGWKVIHVYCYGHYLLERETGK